MNPNPWHGNREPVFVLMRAIDAEAEACDRSARFLEAPASTLNVGGGAFDERLKCEALRDFLYAMRHGANPTGAAAYALEASRRSVRKWNANPRCVTINHRAESHRWEDTCGAMLDDRARRFAGIGEPGGFLTESQIFET